MADLDSIANEAIRQLTSLQSHLADGDRSRGTMVGVARQDWAGTYRDEFDGGIRTIASQSSTVQTDITGLITKIRNELAAAKAGKPGG